MATWRQVDGGFRLTSGRGKNAAVLLDVSFDEIARWARRNSAAVPRLTYRSYGRACSGLRSKLAGYMKHGAGYGMPTMTRYQDFTSRYRDANARDPNGPVGGVLADSRRIVAFKRNGVQIIGWPDGMAKLAQAFQEGRGGSAAEAWLNDPRVRQWVHSHGIDFMPRNYHGHERQVIEPYFRKTVIENLDKWAKTILDKEIAKEIAKTKGVA